jgi:hypothetical protein
LSLFVKVDLVILGKESPGVEEVEHEHVQVHETRFKDL